MRPESNTPRRRKLHALDRVTRLAVCILPLVAALNGCVDPRDVEPGDLWINSIAPDKVLAGSPGFTLTVNTGGGVTLSDNVDVLFNGEPRAGSVVDARTVTAPISAAEVASPGDVDVAVRYDDSADPTAPDLRTTSPVSFKIEAYVRIEIIPSDTTVQVGDSVVYTAEGVLPDSSRVDVTSETVFNSAQSGVAVMDVDVARAVGPGKTTITGAHISGAHVVPATLTVSDGTATTGIVQFAIGELSASSVYVGCFDPATGTFTTPKAVDIGASVTDFAYVPAVGAYLMATPSDLQVWTWDGDCGIKLANSKSFSNLLAFRNLVVLPSSLGGAVASGNSLQGGEVRIWEVTQTYDINERLSLSTVTGTVGPEIGISREGGSTAVVTRAGVTTQVSTASSWPPSSWNTGAPVAISSAFTAFDADASYQGVIASGSAVQAFHVDHANLDLMAIGSPLTTMPPLLKTASWAGLPSQCVVGVPLSGNQLPVYSTAIDGSLAAATPATISEAQYVDALVALPDGLGVAGIETPSGQQGIKVIRVRGGCELDASIMALLTSGSGYANVAAAVR